MEKKSKSIVKLLNIYEEWVFFVNFRFQRGMKRFFSVFVLPLWCWFVVRGYQVVIICYVQRPGIKPEKISNLFSVIRRTFRFRFDSTLSLQQRNKKVSPDMSGEIHFSSRNNLPVLQSGWTWGSTRARISGWRRSRTTSFCKKNEMLILVFHFWLPYYHL